MTPFSCEECRAQLAALTSDANPSAHPKTSDLDEMSAEAAAHLQSCAACRIEYSILRGIVGELRALPSFAAPPDLRARIRNQIARETADAAAKVATIPATTTQAARHATPRHSPRRSLFPRFFVPRWATYSLSGAVLTAFLLFVARDINPDLAPGPEPRDVPNSAGQAGPSQSASSATRGAPALKGTPSALSNRAKSANALNNGALPQKSAPRKAAPVPRIFADGASSSTRLGATAPTTKTPTTGALDGNVSTTEALGQPALNQTQNGTGNGSTSGAFVPKTAAPKTAVPKTAAPQKPSAPRLTPSRSGASTSASRRNGTSGTAPNADASNADASNAISSNADAPSAPTSSASAPLKNNAGVSSSARRFARLELLPPSVAPSLQKAPPMRDADSASRRQGLSDDLSLSKSAAKTGGAFGGSASSDASSSTDSSSADLPSSTMSAPDSSTSVSGALSSAPSSTRSAGTDAAQPSRDAIQSTDDASSEQRAERIYRSRAADESRTTRGDESATMEASPSTTRDTTRRSAAPASAPTARAGARGNTSYAEGEPTSDTALERRAATADSAAKSIQEPLEPPQRNRATKPKAPLHAAKRLDAGKFANQSQSARLTVMPRQNAGRARVLVSWISDSSRAKAVSSVVWQGAARRNQEIVVSLAAPRGNKNWRAQVSLQSANARGEWQTLETSVLSPTSATR